MIQTEYKTNFHKELDKFEKFLKLKEIDGVTKEDMDMLKFYDSFKTSNNISDISVDDNANVADNSILSYYYEAPKAKFKDDFFKLVREELGQEYFNVLRDGYLYFHDSTRAFLPYCFSIDSSRIVNDGIPYITGLKIKPPKKTATYVLHHIQATSDVSQQLAGAVSWPSFFVYMDWYVRKEFGNNYAKMWSAKSKIEQYFQELIYGLNFRFRGSQSSFTNLSIYDKYFMEDLFKDTIYPDSTKPDFTSIDYLQKWFCEYFIRINKEEQLFTFPVLTVAMYSKYNEIQDKEFLDWVSKTNLDFGTFNIYSGALGNLSSCCRLHTDTTVFTGMLGTPSISIGSSRVVTLSLPHIAAECIRTKIDFYSLLDKYTEMARRILIFHRGILESAIKNGRHPLYDHGWLSLKRQFLTVGFVGVYEALEILGIDLASDTGITLATNILKRINETNQKSSTNKFMFNLEQIPAESAAVKLAKKLNLLYGTNYDIFSNQYIPLTTDVSIEDRINIQGNFDKYTQGGGILHLNMDEKIDSPDVMRRLIEYTVSKGVVYFAINYGIVECTKCGKNSVGLDDISECCKAPVRKWTRVVGFLRPVDNFSKARKKEFNQRVFYDNGGVNAVDRVDVS